MVATVGYREKADPSPHPGSDRGRGDDTELRRRLVEETAGFAAAFLRWVDASAHDGLSYNRLRLLRQLAGEGPATMRTVARQLGITARNMTLLVDSLEAEGLAVRQAHATDRRAVLLCLTERGRAQADAGFDRRVAAIARVFDDFPPSRQADLLDLLSSLRSGLQSRTG